MEMNSFSCYLQDLLNFLSKNLLFMNYSIMKVACIYNFNIIVAKVKKFFLPITNWKRGTEFMYVVFLSCRD